jgi:DNA-binding transcriptional regulator YdaS (Cro superfamily)
MNTNHHTEIARACALCGGYQGLARELGVTRQAVHGWLTNSRPLPPVRAIEIERATRGRVRVEKLLPEVPWSVIRKRK